MSRTFVLLLAAASGLSLAAPAQASESPTTPTTPSRVFGAPDTPPTTLPTEWGCFPGRAFNPCEGSLKTTVLSSAQLELRRVARVEDPAPATNQPVDCFYVYPTVTSAQGDNAPRRIDRDVQAVLQDQAAPFSSACRVYAPIYRQATLANVIDSVNRKLTQTSPAQNLAYSDVYGAWNDYLANHNRGRGVILIGHSQGAGMLTRLMKVAVDANPAVRSKIVGAYLPGANHAVPIGARAGGVFDHIPTCSASGEAGCVVAYSMYGAQPSLSAYFGRIGALSAAFGGPQGSDLEVACTNPAVLSGDAGVLRPIVRGSLAPGVSGGLQRIFWNGLPPSAPTPYVVPGDRYTADCSAQNNANVLRLRVGRGSLMPVALPTAEWGLHIGEMSLTLGNLVKIARLQTATWVAAQG